MRYAPPSSAAELLALWEQAAGSAPARRDDALLGALAGDDDEVPASLSARNAALLGLRARLFGNAQRLRCDCPRCAAMVEFDIDCTALAHELRPGQEPDGAQSMEAAGYRIEFRLPAIEDLRAAASADAFVPALLRRCVIRCEREDGTPASPDSLPAAATDALSIHMERLAPGASLDFALDCPDCGEHWQAAMDVGQVLWTELQHGAERLLLDVDALARSYGWSEAEVLALSPARRAAYLQLAGAG